ncbi:MAG: hypothetical protein VB858_09390 [Planctomycetaceae bacterium]
MSQYATRAASACPPSGATESGRPAFLITIDTEGDNLWSGQRTITTRNSHFLPRFQQLCERYGFQPTWLTNWEMVECPVYREFAADALARGQAEIGMHLHAWNNPPHSSLTEDDFRRLPYLIQYSPAVMRRKIRAITDRLEDVFGTRMVSHRAGRWAFNSTYARLLVEHGYRVDCSVTPHVCWQHESLQQPHSIDYRHFSEDAYFVDLDDISRESDRSLLLELPMTILKMQRPWPLQLAVAMASLHSFGNRVANRFVPTRWWLRPDGFNSERLLSILDVALEQKRDYVEFMLHSSELMPGGSPRFNTEQKIERLYDDLERLFEKASQSFEGLTLAGYHNRTVTRQHLNSTNNARPSEPVAA